MRGLINICINRNGVGMIKLLFLDTSGLSKRDSNTAVVLLAIFICTIWYNRDNHGDKLIILKRAIMTKLRYHKFILGEKMPKIFNDRYCQIDMEFLNNMVLTNT